MKKFIILIAFGVLSFFCIAQDVKFENDEIKKLLNEPVKDIELQRAKTQIKASLLMSLESSST